jgi:hypothetical protein
MTTEKFQMSAELIAKTIGTVGSPLIVISELIKNAVDASATQIDVYYNINDRSIIVKNDHAGFSFEDIKRLSQPGHSFKKKENNLLNEKGMYFTGSKGLGLLSVFTLCEEAEIITTIEDKTKCHILLSKQDGSISYTATNEKADVNFTTIILKNVNPDTIEFLQSESEIKKLRHISTYLYKNSIVPFPKILLHIGGQDPTEINFSCEFPEMMYDVTFSYDKTSKTLTFQCKAAPDKCINQNEIVFTDFTLEALQEKLRESYSIVKTIPTRSNELHFTDFSGVPTFEGRILVYEKRLAGGQLKTYGAGVNIYINDFALYNYLEEDNDWLGFAYFSQRKKATRLKPHNVFGYVNFPNFDENNEMLQISNERADFIKDMTFQKFMYFMKGVVLFTILNIDIADKNPEYKVQDDVNFEMSSSDETDLESSESDNPNDEYYSDTDTFDKKNDVKNKYDGGGSDRYQLQSIYKLKADTKKCLTFTEEELKYIESLKGTDNLGNKICQLVYELYRLDLQHHRYAVAFLYRSLIESSTKKAASKYSTIKIHKDLEASVISALDFFSSICRRTTVIRDKEVKTCRTCVTKNKLIDILNEYVHNETAPDAFILQETWNTMKKYIMMCLKV